MTAEDNISGSVRHGGDEQFEQFEEEFQDEEAKRSILPWRRGGEGEEAEEGDRRESASGSPEEGTEIPAGFGSTGSARL